MPAPRRTGGGQAEGEAEAQARSRRPRRAPLALAAGTVVATTMDREITSKTDKPGATVTGTVASDVTDATGRVVIPAGSKVTLTITEIHESENKGDKTGKLTLTPTAVEIAGESHALDGSAVALERTLRDRKTNAGDVAKVGAGTADRRHRRPRDRRQHQGRRHRRHHRRRRRHPARHRDAGPGRRRPGELARRGDARRARSRAKHGGRPTATSASVGDRHPERSEGPSHPEFEPG